MDPSTHQALYLSYAAYCGAGLNASFSCYWCSKAPHSFKFVGSFGEPRGGASFGYVGVSGDAVFLVYRGTDNLAGWLGDLNLRQVDNPWGGRGRVHAGFASLFHNTSASALSLVRRAASACPSCSSLVISGHSLGAALSTAAASFFASSRSVPALRMRLVNFGAPRLGNKEFATWFNALGVPTQRMTWKRDPVPHVPFRNTPLVPYWHVARELFGGKGGDDAYRECNGSGEDPACSDQYTITNVLDHGIYMGVNILRGVPHGCLYTDNKAAEALESLRRRQAKTAP